MDMCVRKPITDGVSRHNSNGYACTTFERRRFLEIIYNQLPDKSYIKTGKRVCDVIDREDGVTVYLTDGSVEEGDILIGCDGVHSTVRELMWRDANEAIPDYITAMEKTCKSSFQLFSKHPLYKQIVSVNLDYPLLTPSQPSRQPTLA